MSGLAVSCLLCLGAGRLLGKAGELRVEIDPHGRVDLVCDGGVLIERMGLVLVDSDGEEKQPEQWLRASASGASGAVTLAGGELRCKVSYERRGEGLIISLDLEADDASRLREAFLRGYIDARAAAPAECRLDGRKVGLAGDASFEREGRRLVFKGLRGKELELLRPFRGPVRVRSLDGKYAVELVFYSSPPGTAPREGKGKYLGGVYYPAHREAPSKAFRVSWAACAGLEGFSGPPVVFSFKERQRGAEAGSIEFGLGFLADWASAFDPEDVSVEAEIEAPSGAVRVPGFYTEPHVPRQGKLVAEGLPSFAVRYAPRERGRHRVRVKVATSGGESSAEAAFDCDAGFKGGFVRESGRDPRYLEISDGSPFYPLGLNVAWPDSTGLEYYEKAFRRLSKAGGNLCRVWSASWWAPLDGRAAGELNVESAAAFDEILRAAAENGVKVALCLENYYDYRHNYSRSPYSRFAKDGAGFLASEKARAAYRQKLRYCVARWHAEESLAWWELWNEVDYLKARKDAVAWTGEMASLIRDLDPSGRPVTTSLGNGNSWEELWKLDEVGIVQLHAYIPPRRSLRAADEFNSARFLDRQLTPLASFKKPVLVGEFGFSSDGPRAPHKSSMNERDPGGVHIHNALWATMLSGCCGAALPWWWESIFEKGQEAHLGALARFLEGEDLRDGALRSLRSRTGSEVEVFALRSPGRAYLWIQNPRSTWYMRVVGSHPPKVLKQVSFVLPGLDDGEYLVEWWDARKGSILTARTAFSRKREIELHVPDFATDIACKVRPARTSR